MGDFMHSKQRLVLLVSSVLSVVSVLLCIRRMMYWEAASAVCIVDAGTGWTNGAALSAVGLYVVTIALLIGTTVLAARWWNHSA